MRITRKKGIRKTIRFYKTCFALRDPYRVLIDISYIEAALQGKIHVKDQLLKMLDGRVTPMVTDCVLKEIENAGGRLHGHSIVAKAFYRLKCSHHPCKSSSDCFLDEVANSNAKGFMIASNDDAFKHRIRSIGGIPLLCIHGQVPILEGPSDESKQLALSKEQNKSAVPEWEKEIHGMESSDSEAPVVKKKKKGKNPNPLSCRKKIVKEEAAPAAKRNRRKKRTSVVT